MPRSRSISRGDFYRCLEAPQHLEKTSYLIILINEEIISIVIIAFQFVVNDEPLLHRCTSRCSWRVERGRGWKKTKETMICSSLLQIKMFSNVFARLYYFEIIVKATLCKINLRRRKTLSTFIKFFPAVQPFLRGSFMK